MHLLQLYITGNLLEEEGISDRHGFQIISNITLKESQLSRLN